MKTQYFGRRSSTKHEKKVLQASKTLLTNVVENLTICVQTNRKQLAQLGIIWHGKVKHNKKNCHFQENFKLNM